MVCVIRCDNLTSGTYVRGSLEGTGLRGVKNYLSDDMVCHIRDDSHAVPSVSLPVTFHANQKVYNSTN